MNLESRYIKYTNGISYFKISKDPLGVQPVDYPNSEKEAGYHMLCAAYKPLKLEYIEYLSYRGKCK